MDTLHEELHNNASNTEELLRYAHISRFAVSAKNSVPRGNRSYSSQALCFVLSQAVLVSNARNNHGLCDSTVMCYYFRKGKVPTLIDK